MRHFLFLIIFSFFMPLYSYAADDCSNTVEYRANISVQRIYYPEDGRCSLSVTPFLITDIYRDYSFDDRGGMLIFINYGNFDSELRFGTREFYFLPKKKKFPEFRWDDDKGALEITMVNGQKAYFHYSDAQLASISQAKVSISADLHPRSKGGISIQVNEGLLLDTGFSLDHLSSQEKIRASEFTDKKGHSCKILNRSIFTYLPNGDVLFGLSNDELKSLLAIKCPIFDQGMKD